MRRVSCIALVTACTMAAAVAEPPGRLEKIPKKLIEYGWDVPNPEFIKAHIREMEQRPFDGLIFRLQGGSNVLEPAPWDEAKFAKDYEDAAQIAWEKFTDNFVIMHAASEQDWFDDAHWRAIEKNVAMVARGGKLARCAGVCFDPEPYGKNPWNYVETAHKDQKTFPEYQAKARERGAQFIRAIETEMPNPRILTFYLLALFDEYCRPMPPDERANKLMQHPYGLYPAFINGILDAAGPGMRLIDGNENAYYYQESRPYFDAYHLITQRGQYLVDPALWQKYRTHIRAGQALYVDQYFGLRTDKVLGHYMTPEERPKWFEHNVYWALYTSDEYVWCYSERMNWWTHTDVPPGAEDAIRAARDEISAGKSLDFDLAPIVDAAAKRK